MRTTLLIAALAAITVAPALAQQSPLADAMTKAAVEAAGDSVNQALGGKGTTRAQKSKDGPNYGRSEDHRRDGGHGHKGKGKAKGQDKRNGRD
ncbi:MAG: hypothetical protein ACM33T_14505 [Solirubrobacterales bacterium]